MSKDQTPDTSKSAYREYCDWCASVSENPMSYAEWSEYRINLTPRAGLVVPDDRDFGYPAVSGK